MFSFRYTYLGYPLSGLPIFIEYPSSLATPVKRTTYQVVCQAEGFPRPVISWRRVGMSLPAGRTEVNQGTLIIKNLTPADSGLYECIATSTMGSKRARINVAVQEQKLGMLFCLSRVVLVNTVPIDVRFFLCMSCKPDFLTFIFSLA